MMRRWLMWMLPPLMFCLMSSVGARAQTVDCSSTFATITFAHDMNILTGQNMTTSGLNSRVTCRGLSADQTVRFCMGLGPGENSINSAASRKIANASKTSFLEYNIYKTTFLGPVGGVWTPVDTDKPYIDLTQAFPSRGVTYFEATIFQNQTATPVGIYTDKIKVHTHYYVYNTAIGEARPISCAVTPVYATPAPYDLTVTATITANCTISATDMTFDPQTIITRDLYAESALTVKCTNDPTNPALPYIALDNGLKPDAGQRRMANQYKPGKFIKYDLYSNNSRTSPWGSTFWVDTVEIARCATSTPIPVYGKIPKPDISPASGLYTDRVTATVNF